MSFFENLTRGLKNRFDSRKEEREALEKIQREINLQKRQIFEDKYREDLLEVSKAKALKEASELSGLRKLRAMNRLRNLDAQDSAPPISFFEKLSEYTKKNVARREENLQRTEMLRKVAEEDKEKRYNENIQTSQQRGMRGQLFGKSTWRM